MPRFLVTGGCGFIGSHIVRELLKNDGNDVVCLDRMRSIGRLDRLRFLPGERLRVVHGDLGEPLSDALLARIGPVDHVIHSGAESHVSRSLLQPGEFVRSNIIGTLNVLEAARKLGPKRFIYVSTDEVLGPAGERPGREDDPLRPTNPYAASKAAGEYLVKSYHRSFGILAVVTRMCNLYGEGQNIEKLVPTLVKRLLRGEAVDVHTGSDGRMGARHWAYAGECARAVAWLAGNGEPGRVYHLTDGVRRTNLEMAQAIADILSVKLCYNLRVSDRPAYDQEYDLEESEHARHWKMAEGFDELLARTVRWTRDHPEFLEA